MNSKPPPQKKELCSQKTKSTMSCPYAIKCRKDYMTTISKIILAFSAACIAFSFAPVGANFYYGIIRPIGAVAFIVFFIINMLGKEMRKFDADHPPVIENKADPIAIRSRAAPRVSIPHN